MKKKNRYPKVALDMFAAQGAWSLWFLGIITTIHIIKTIISINTGSTQEDFYLSSFVSFNIYMFIIGIIAAYSFLPFYVKNGVTRKDYYKGSIIATLVLSVVLVIISLLITGLEHGMLNIANLPITFDQSLTEMMEEDDGGILIAMIVKMIVVSPYIGLTSNWLVSIVLACLNLVSSYVIGWLIGAGYYRYGWIIGFGFIGMAIVLMTSWDILWGSEIAAPLSGLLGFTSIDVPFIVSFLVSVMIIAFVLWIIRAITRKVVVKL